MSQLIRVSVYLLLSTGATQAQSAESVAGESGIDWGRPEENESRVVVRFRVLAVARASSEDVLAGELPAGDLIRIDRGARDGVAVGDPVEFTPKGSAVLLGQVVGVGDRACQVQLRGGSSYAEIEPGVGGTVRVVKPQRLEESVAQTAENGQPGGDSVNAEVDDSRPEWLKVRDSWTEDMPLLARVRVERPEERGMDWGGRYYFHTGITSALTSSRGDAVLRGGVDLWATNPFGKGGELAFDSEYDLRALWIPGEDGEDEGRSRLRLDRLSYTRGGTRYEPEQHRIGRFLQTLPEFGVLDGYEWSQRLEGGDSFGASAGYVVEDDFDAGTGHSFAASGFYRWVADERERITATAGLAKSFHNGVRDRDLGVVRADYYPEENARGGTPWDLHLSVLLDRYSEDDYNKDGIALTRLQIETRQTEPAGVAKSAGGSFDALDELRFAFRHIETPEAKQFELSPLAMQALADEREDRLQMEMARWSSSTWRWHTFAGVWSAGGSEDDVGGDLELGLELLDVAEYGPGQGAGSAGIFVFGSHGRYSNLTGFLCSYGRHWGTVGWEVLYEFTLSDQYGFSDATDDIYQHRLRLVADVATWSGWNIAGHSDLITHGDDGSVSIGVFLGRSF